MNRDVLLMALPPVNDRLVLITGRQKVSDIVNEVLDAHKFFAKDYDCIATKFLQRSTVATLHELFNFIKLNIAYVEETEDYQYTKSPAALIETGEGDCKMYASFIGGVLDALNRLGSRIDWCYAFAKYKTGENHVFIIVEEGLTDYWIDPVLPDFDMRNPQPETINKKYVGMALYRMSGTGSVQDRLPINFRGRPLEKAVGCANTPTTVGSVGVVDWVKANPLISVALAVVGVMLIMPSKRRKRA